jgi:hypothetical protein
MPHDGTSGASTLWSEADALEPFAPPKRVTPARHAGSAEQGAWVDAFASSSSLAFEDEGDEELEGASAWEERGGDFEAESDYETELQEPTSESYDFEDDESHSTPVGATCRCPSCHCEHEAFSDAVHEADDAEREAMTDPEFGGAEALSEWEYEGSPENWAELTVPASVFEEEEDGEDEATSALEFGLSPLAKRSRLHPGHGARSAPWNKEVYGLVVHTTGGTLPGKALKKGTTPDKYAADYYLKTGGTHYVNGWGGVDGGHLHQVMNEKVQAQGVGTRKDQPEKNQWKSVAAGRFEADLPPIVVRLWRARWPGVEDSLKLLPVHSSANRTYVHVECPPCVYYRNGTGPLIVEPSAPPLRDGLRFTRAQHETVARLAWDIAQRHNFPSGQAWWRTPRLLGHEDITPLSRFDKQGCWDPGGLREKPYFDWPFVYSYLEKLSGGVVPSAPPPAPGATSLGSSSVIGLLGSIADRFRHLIQTGQEALAIAEAVRSGQTDLNKLTSLVFFARHPELGGRKLRADERELAQEWLRIRDTLVQPILARLKPGSPAATTPKAPDVGSSPAKKGSVNEAVVARIKQYAPLVQAAAKKHGVEAALINGFIAAESGGNPSLVAKSGYTGLMQSDKLRSHLVPATSIDEGAKKLASFRKIMDGILRKRGHTYDGMSDVDQVHLLALAYNAGPVTVAKALQYAAEAGRPAAWREADHYKRALLFTGAYSTAQAAGQCLPNATKAERTSRIQEAEAVRKKHKFKKEWRTAPDPQAWATVGPTLSAFVKCAIDFKHRNSPRYAAKILAYRDRFREK